MRLKATKQPALSRKDRHEQIGPGVFGISAYEAMIIAVIALIVIGPQRMPEYAKKFADFLKTARGMFQDAQARLKEETGVAAEDLRKYDPRQYDPRRIIRESLNQTSDEAQPGQGPAIPQFSPLPQGEPAPFDDQAT